VGGPIDLEPFMPTIREAARNRRPVAWFGWLCGTIATALGALPPMHWPLFMIGIGLLVGMTTWTFLRFRDRDRRPPRP
jgi:hypothetical protein